jgi:hypothetical protein
MTYYGRFRRSELYTLLARINYHLQQWVRHKYRRLRPTRAMERAWKRVTAQYPVGLEYSIMAVTSVFSQQRGLVRRRSDTRPGRRIGPRIG